MRAVPDNFDTIQALHSPYGAVHAFNLPITTSAGYSAAAAEAALASTYSNHTMRPLMVDVQRANGSSTIGLENQTQQQSQQPQYQHVQHYPPSLGLSQPGLSTGYRHIGFGPVTATGGSGGLAYLSPLPSSSSSEHDYSSSGTTSASSTPVMSPHTSNSSAQKESKNVGLDSKQFLGAQDFSQTQHQHVRCLQTPQQRETVSRLRSDSLQSPLRSSILWKGDSLDHNTYNQPRTDVGGSRADFGYLLPSPLDGHGNVLSSAGLGSCDSYSGLPGCLRFSY